VAGVSATAQIEAGAARVGVASIAQVEPLTTARALRGPFDYRLPEELRAGVDVGTMLVVPFGRREVLGVVVGLSDHSDVAAEKLLAPLRALELGVPVDLVALAEWLASEYCSTIARALGLVLPPGVARGARPLSRLVAELTSEGRAALEGSAGNTGAAGDSGDSGAADGVRGARPAGLVRLTKGQRETLHRLLDGPRPAALTGTSHASLRRLAERGLLELERRGVARRPHNLAVGARRPSPPPLTQEQQEVMRSLNAALLAGRHEQRLLHGVTGSGKTEIYLRTAAAALEQGRGAIVLVPEIALTPQIVGRFIERFGDTVAVLHSRLAAGERHDEWRRLRAGEARVCVGPRSAVFAPIQDLGLIVVDEEHDASYKHEGDPRYDARDVAARRARDNGALLLLGSATPRPESYLATPRLRLPRRVDGRPLPAVEILDMREQTPGLHPLTAQALAEVRAQRGKAIVLLNRRGWSNFLSCRSCGTVWGCPECDVALVLHRAEGYMACHHCGHREATPTRCNCGSTAVARHGSGTERVQHELMRALDDGDFPVFRLDADVVAAGGKDAAIGEHQGGGVGTLLRRFEAADAGVLIGTQMVAKGHDFPDVTLGVVLDADGTLRFPDFRAEERTFALVAQLAGRVGRGAHGRVLVQTIAPSARSIVLASRHDSEGFLESELERRLALGYPPYSHLIRIVCAAPEVAPARAAATAVGRGLNASLGGAGDDLFASVAPRASAASVLGPAALFRLRGRERQVLIVKARDRRAAVEAVGEAVRLAAGAREHTSVSFSVDVDPQ
jgi:primosomal protein N' (replication factor Y) (superfamily II helicase)